MGRGLSILSKDDNKLREHITKYLNAVQKEREKFFQKYPPDPPNEVCFYACLSGLKVENSFGPSVHDFAEFFETEFEKIYIWTSTKDKNSWIVSQVKKDVKGLPFWKTVGHILHLAQYFYDAFEISIDIEIKYHWMYYFSPEQAFDEILLYEDSDFIRMDMETASIVKATKIEAFAPLIELLLRDDICYTALSQMLSSFELHYCCLICELGLSPIMKHESHEPEIWQHGYYISKMEAGIVQACRCVEGILGEPPNRAKQNSLLKHKEKWKRLLGINPDELYDKVNMSYLDFYYSLFFELRNPSAHSYGNIHYELERKRAIEAQCFAAIVLRGYIETNMKSHDEATRFLKFNRELLARVSDTISTSVTD